MIEHIKISGEEMTMVSDKYHIIVSHKTKCGYYCWRYTDGWKYYIREIRELTGFNRNAWMGEEHFIRFKRHRIIKQL